MSCRRSSKKVGDGNVMRSELFSKRFSGEAGGSDSRSESCKLSSCKRFPGEAAVAWGAN